MKRVVSVLLVFIISLAFSFPVLANTNSLSVDYSYGENNSIEKNSLFNLTFYIRNSSSNSISEITTELTGLTNDGVRLSSGSNTQNVTLSGNTARVNYLLTTSENTNVGFHEITLTVKAKDGKVLYSEKVPINIKENASPLSPAIRIIDYKVDNENILSGSDFNLKIMLQNTSDSKISDVKVSVDATDYNTFSIVRGIESKYTSVDGEGVTIIEFPIHAGENLKTGRYPIKLNVSYKSRDLEKSEMATAFIAVKAGGSSNSETPSDSKPIIIIEKYTFGGNKVMAGQTFPLTMTFYNTSATSIENIKITLSDTTGTFTPSSTSNTIFIEKIPAKGKVTKDIEFYTKPDAEAKSYTVNMSCSYEAMSKDGRKQYESDELLAIPVQQTDRFEAGEVECYGEVIAGMETGIAINFANKGKSKIFNLTVSSEGDFKIVQNQSLYIGNLDSGTSQTYDCSIIPANAGKTSGVITFTYEDANNDKKTVKKEFSLDVLDMGGGVIGKPMPPIDGGGEVMPPIDEKKKSPIVLISIIAGSLIVAAIVTVVIVKKVKAKRSAKLDEDF